MESIVKTSETAPPIGVIKKLKYYFLDFIFRYGIGALAIFGFIFFTKLAEWTNYTIGSWLYLTKNLSLFGVNGIISINHTWVLIADIFTYAVFSTMIIAFFGTKIYEIYQRKFVSTKFQFRLNVALRVPFAAVFTLSVGQMLVALMDANNMIVDLIMGDFGERTIFVFLTLVPLSMVITLYYIFFRSKSTLSLQYASNFIQGVIAVTMITSLLIIVNTGAYGINLDKTLNHIIDNNYQQKFKDLSAEIYDSSGKLIQRIVVNGSQNVLNKLGIVYTLLGYKEYNNFALQGFSTAGEYFAHDLIDNGFIDNGVGPLSNRVLAKPPIWGVNNNWQFGLIFVIFAGGNLFAFVTYFWVLTKKWSKKEWKPPFHMDKNFLSYSLFTLYIVCALYYAFDQILINHLTDWNPNLYNGGILKLCEGSYRGTTYYWITYWIVIPFVFSYPAGMVIIAKIRKLMKDYSTTDQYYFI